MALNDFLATVGGKDLARQNRFEVEIRGPAGMADREVNLLCESVQMPGQNIRTVEDDLRFGPARDHAQAFTYGDISLTFICAAGMRQKFFFEEWQKLIVNKGTDQWQAKFYTDYIGEILIHQLNKEDKKLYTVKVHEAYPKTINAQDFSLGSTDAYQTVAVDFAYRWWERTKAMDITITAGTGQNGGDVKQPTNPPFDFADDAGGGGGGGTGSDSGSKNPGTVPGTFGVPF